MVTKFVKRASRLPRYPRINLCQGSTRFTFLPWHISNALRSWTHVRVGCLLSAHAFLEPNRSSVDREHHNIRNFRHRLNKMCVQRLADFTSWFCRNQEESEADSMEEVGIWDVFGDWVRIEIKNKHPRAQSRWLGAHVLSTLPN